MKRITEARALLERECTTDRIEIARYAFTPKEKIEVLRQLDREILELLEDEVEIIREIEHADEFNQEVLEFLLRVKDLELTTGATSATSRGIGTDHHNTCLPKLTVCGFDGDITQWLPFWDSYEAVVHLNPSLSDV